MYLNNAMNKFLFFIILSLISFLGFSQEVVIKDGIDRQPLPNVAVYNQDKSKSNISDINGKVNLSIFSTDEIIFFTHLGYKDLKVKKSDTPKIIYLENDSDALSEVTLSISKSKVQKSRIAEKIEVITSKKIKQIAPQTAADLLAQTPGVRVQKSQGGGGSPVIRGFEANRVLLVMDNVRMNNAIYRSGHLQNAITVSPFSLDRTEVIFGPSSVIYGSDALGGVIHFYTRTPRLDQDKTFKGNANSRYSSANNEFTQGFGGELSFKNWASYTAVSASKFGDLRMGTNRSHGFDNWGLVPTYSDNNNSVYNNTPVTNSRPHVQRNTGYSQFDVLQKFNIKTTDNSNLILNFQLSESSNIPRFDKLTELKNGSLKFAEWYYGPQKRLLISPQYQTNPGWKIINSATFTAAYQKVKESRIKRKYGKLERTYQNEAVDIFSINADFKAQLAEKRDFFYGLEFTHNDVNSNAYGKNLAVNNNTITGFSDNTIVQSRYPDGGSSYTTAAIYVNYRQDINTKMTLNTGGRYTNTNLKAKFIDQTYIRLPETDLKLQNSSFTANIGLTYRPTDLTRFNAVVSSGFRSPNIDDIGKIREKSGLLTVPNVGLRPEYAYNGEVGITKFIKNKRNQITINAFYTLLDQYIVRNNFVVEGDTSTPDATTVIYDGEEATTIANTNGDTAYILGGTFDFSLNPVGKFYLQGNATFTQGRTYDTDNPLPSILPFFGSAGIRYNNGTLDAGIDWRYSAMKAIEDYSPGGEDNLDQAPVDNNGNTADLPSWNTLNATIGYQLNEAVRMQVGLDNIFDTHYKEFASGISAPGRNLRVSMDLSF